MNNRKQPERRTFLQDRFEILIKRQKTGAATFSELTELDEIVNRDPEIREKVIRETLLMEEADKFSDPSNSSGTGDELYPRYIKQQSLPARIKTFFARIFISKISTVKIRVSVYYVNQIIVI
jgi:hypothetical protein